MGKERYLVLARKYRPKTFPEVIGQEHAATTLQNAIRTGRVAHAYLFAGPRGVGKTTMARILAKALNCERGPTPDPCNECSICKSIDTGEDVDVIEIDGASNTGVDHIRDLRDNARFAPARSRHKIYVIDEVHMLSTSAFNALLKTLEEPPPHVKFIFATTEPHKVIETVRSRCQRFDFRRIPAALISKTLSRIAQAEHIEAADGVFDAIARAAHGGMRDAESLLDQLAALDSRPITLEDLERITGGVSPKTVEALLRAVADHDARTAIELADDALAKGAADDELLRQLIEGFRELLLARVAGADSPLIDRSQEDRRALAELAGRFDTDALMYLVQMFAETRKKSRESTQSRIVLELALIKAAEIHQLRPLDEILAQVHAPSPRAAGSPRPAPRRAKAPAPNHAQAPPPSRAEAPRTGDPWKDTLAVIERDNAPLAAFVAKGTCRPAGAPAADGPMRYILELDPIGVENAKANQSLLEKILSDVSGRPSVIEVRQAAAPPRPPGAGGNSPKGRHVRKAMELFHARVVATTDPHTERDTNG